MNNKEFNISLRKAKMKGKADIETANRAIALIFKFFKKNFRKEKEQVIMAKEVNEEIWKKSNNIQSKIQVQAVEKDGKVLVYLKDSKELKEIAEKEKTKAASKKETKKEEKTAEAKAEEKPAKKEDEKKEEKEKTKGKKQ